MKKQKNTTRIIAIVLVLLMALALVPIAASAAAPGADLPYEISYVPGAAGESAGTTDPTTAAADAAMIHLGPNGFSKDDYTFYKWTDGINEYSDDINAPITDLGNIWTVGETKNTATLTALWTINVTYTDGTNTSDDPHIAGAEYTVISCPTDFSPPASLPYPASYYVFDNWLAGISTTYDPEDTIPGLAAPLTLTAQWKLSNPVTITFSANGGTGAPDAVTVPSGYTYTLPNQNPTRENYIFLGWDTDSSKVSDPTYTPSGTWTITPTENTTLYGIWKADTVAVTYVDQNEEHPTAVENQTRGGSFKLKSASTFSAPDASKMFNGWLYNGHTYEAESYFTTPTDPSVTAVQFKATFAEKGTVNFETNGAGTISSVVKPIGTVIQLQAPSKSGHDFKGWYKNNSFSGTCYPAGDYQIDAPNTTLFAKWISTDVTFHYLANGGTITGATTEAVTRGQDYSYPAADYITPPSETQAFDCWELYDSATATTPLETGKQPEATYATGDETPKDLYVKPKWTSKKSVTFKNGTTTVDTVYVAAGHKVPADAFPTVTKDGYTFREWRVAGTTTKFDENYTVNADTEVTASWYSNAVTVTFDPNTTKGGSGTPKTQSNMSRTTAVKLNPFSGMGFTAPEGMGFGGWVRNPNSTTVDFGDNVEVTWNGTESTAANYVAIPADESAGAVTLYALWVQRMDGAVKIKKSGTFIADDAKVMVGDELTAEVVDHTPAAGETFYYHWMADGAVVNSDISSGTYTVQNSDLGKKLSCVVSNAPTFPHIISSTEHEVDGSADQKCVMTVQLDPNAPAFKVKVNGTEVASGGTSTVGRGAEVKVTLVPGTSNKHATELKLDGTTIYSGSDIKTDNPVTVPDAASCTLVVKLADNAGTNPGVKEDTTADTSAAQTAILNAANPKGAYRIQTRDMVACWDGNLNNRLTPAQVAAEGGLAFTLPYPANSNKVGSKLITNMKDAYAKIEVWHYKTDGTAVKITGVTPSEKFDEGIAVPKQMDFSPYAAVLTPKDLDGSVTLDPSSAHVGTPITATYSKSTYGNLQYQWQTRPKDSTDESAWTNVGTGQTYTPKASDKDKSLRCVVTTANPVFEGSSVASKTLTVAAVPNPVQKQYIINNGNTNHSFAQPGLIGNLSDEMEFNIYPSSSKPDADDGGWRAVKSGKTVSDNLYESGTYWVRFKGETDKANYRSTVIDEYYTVTATPDSVSVNRLYFTASGSYAELISGRVWLVPAGKSINVTANSENTNYYKITQIRYENLDTGKITIKTINKANTGSTGSFTVNNPYWVQASAGVYGSKTGDSSHLELWVELAALSMMGLGAALVIGRKKLKEQK